MVRPRSKIERGNVVRSGRRESGPLPVESEIYRAMMLISLDRRDEAKQLARGLVSKAGAQPVLMSAIAEILAMCGQTAAADRIARDYNLFSENSPISKFRQALLSLALENSEKAMSLLSAACEEREAELIWLAHDPRLDRVRADRRFGPLLAEVMHASSSPLETAASREERRTKHDVGFIGRGPVYVVP